MRDFFARERSRDHARDAAARGEHRVCQRAHHAHAGSAVDEPNLTPHQRRGEGARGVEIGGP
jgi:hypothetical protein